LQFYKNIPALQQPISAVLANPAYFKDIPENWHVVVADINNSTGAVSGGKHADVNLIAAGCLIVALNISKAQQVEIPYFFGGDGGTVLVPDFLLEKVLAGLQAHKQNSLKNFSLDLRIGSVPVKEIYNAGYEMKLAKVEMTAGFLKPILIGNGLKYSEKRVKQNEVDGPGIEKKEMNLQSPDELNLQGMECRWDEVRPPSKAAEVVCLLIEATDPNRQMAVYRDVLNTLEEIYGNANERHPLTIKMLRLKNSVQKIQKEMLARYSKTKPFFMLKRLVENFIGAFYFRYDLTVNKMSGHQYLSQLIAQSEILTIDGRINAIISGTKENRIRFIKYLTEQEQSGILVFGHHVSPSSIMTCYVEDMKNKHTHFVDGSDGGYTAASRELKPKLQS